MFLFLAFSITLLLAVLISDLADRSVLSVSVFFLAAGLLVGSGMIVGNVGRIDPQLLGRLSELALFAVLFTDGMRTGGIGEIRKYWHAAVRPLLIGMPLTIAAIALLGRYVVGMSWIESFLIGAALSPTDPVFVSGIFHFEAIPDRVKRVLNVESGVNDGLALPIVLLLLASHSHQNGAAGATVEELAAGVGLGFAVTWFGIRLEKLRFFAASRLFKPLHAFAIGLLVLALAYVTGANLFLAAFSAGITVASLGQGLRDAFEQFGELVAELLKLAALLLFGAAIAHRLFTPIPGREYLFVVLATFAVRPVAVYGSFLGNRLRTSEKWLVGWFGPKGFASVVYGLMILSAGFHHVAHLIAVSVTASIVLFSSTDILIGRWFEKHHKPRTSDKELPADERAA